MHQDQSLKRRHWFRFLDTTTPWLKTPAKRLIRDRPRRDGPRTPLMEPGRRHTEDPERHRHGDAVGGQACDD
jgi:hypothetical protein